MFLVFFTVGNCKRISITIKHTPEITKLVFGFPEKATLNFKTLLTIERHLFWRRTRMIKKCLVMESPALLKN